MVDYEAEVVRLKKERNAVLLAHYYQEGDIQDVADVVGDSLQLAQAAKKTTADVICFAGVHFMAETAKILNPETHRRLARSDRWVLARRRVPRRALRAHGRRKYPGSVTISYINCSAEVKALSDYICTSSNADKIVNAVPKDRTILFAPDRNLGRFLEKKLDRKMVLWQGSCIVHETFSERKLIALKTRHPDAEILAHPECEDAVLHMADYIGSTTGILKHALASPKKEFIVATEAGILHQMEKQAAGRWEDVHPRAPRRATAAATSART